jgi:uncharacterized protein (DUF2132 family)
MLAEQKNNPLHGKTLEFMVNALQEFYGWEQLGLLLPFKCFTNDPNLNSSLKFLRKTPWARAKTESLFLKSFSETRNKNK